MILYSSGNLLDSGADALVNTVNTVGVMGKGVALQFRRAFPQNYEKYREACKRYEINIGKMFLVWENDLFGDKKLIINFPTKVHWGNPSQYSYIQSGLESLREHLIELPISSVAIPALGCGNGGLQWGKVKPMIEAYLSGVPQRVIVYEPL